MSCTAERSFEPGSPHAWSKTLLTTPPHWLSKGECGQRKTSHLGILLIGAEWRRGGEGTSADHVGDLEVSFTNFLCSDEGVIHCIMVRVMRCHESHDLNVALIIF